MTIEGRYGVPTVAMHTDKFDRVVRSVAQVNGMPGLRQVFVPQPIMGKTPAELRAALHDQPLTLSGHRLINLRHEHSEARREPDGETYHGIARFRATTEPTG